MKQLNWMFVVTIKKMETSHKNTVKTQLSRPYGVLSNLKQTCWWYHGL